MGFENRSFENPIYEELTEEPTRVVIISCEGSVTEPEYFETIKSKLKDHISSLLEIEIVPKESNASEPKDVLKNLQKFVEKYDFNKGYDSLWLVCDREKVDSRKKGLIEVLPECNKNGYSLAVTNPLFEFWLLLHVVDISKYDKKTLFDNAWVSNKRRYIDKELSNILDNGYNKKKGKFNKDIVTMQNIKNALQQEKLFENNKNKILDNLGSNVSDLIHDILQIPG